MYHKLLGQAVSSKSILLEEYAREMITSETLHLDEVNKMLRSPGEMEVFRP
jgi:bacterioferritin